MRTKQIEFIDSVIDPIPLVGPLLADLLYTWTGLSDAMNLRRLAAPVTPPPPGDNVVQLTIRSTVAEPRKAA